MSGSESAPASLAITLFGPLQVRVDGLLLPPFRSRKHLWVVALLTLRHNQPVEREWLAGTLWPDVEQSSAFANLRPVLSELRKALGEQGNRLQSPDRHTLMLDLTGADVDVLRFDSAIKSGKLAGLQQAVALYRGPLLEGCNEEWVPQERDAREQVYLQALQKLGDASLANGEYEVSAGYYQQAVRIDPWREKARRGWMEALSRNGDTNSALQVYREFITFLKDDPKAVPDEQTSALYQRLRSELRQKVSTQTAVTTEPIAVPLVKGYLPHPLTDLVGREDECMEVALLLRRSRLVTLTGTGGIGKTRLALAVAREVVGEYGDGVWLVALESLSDVRLVAHQISSVLGMKEEPNRTPLQSVTEHLRRKRLLLVLDNCEHLLEASAQLAGHLLQECREVRILATSREALRITGETVWAVPALTAPELAHLPQARVTLLRVLMGYESVQLFVERAQSVQKSFLLTQSNAHMVAQVCRQLEGIPLAIELAAARVRAMSLEQIASRLEDYLGVLTGGSRTARSRQQTLRATLDWSYALLSEEERCVLRRLSVFAGGCTLEAAETVCAEQGRGKREENEGRAVVQSRGPSESGAPLPLPSSLFPDEVLDLLTSLVDKSLIVFEDRGAAEGRYRLLEMVRQYAGERLQANGEAEQVKTRHRDCFLALAETAEPLLSGAEQAIWLERLETEHDNLRAALAWLEPQAQGAEEGLRLAGDLWKFWETRCHFSEGRACLSKALERNGARTKSRARALTGAGMLAYHHGDYAAANELHKESLAILRDMADRRGIAFSLLNLGNVAYSQGNYEAARTLGEQCLVISRELGDKEGIAASLHSLGSVASSQGDYGAARDLEEQSLAIQRVLEDKGGIALSLSSLGNVAFNRGDYTGARVLYEQSLAIQRELGDRRSIAYLLNNLGLVAYSQGDYEATGTLMEESLAIRRETGAKASIANSLHSLGTFAHALGDYDAARARLQESLNLFRETGNSFIIHALGALGHVERDAGDFARAATLYQESLRLRREMADVLTIVSSLEDFAHLARRQGQSERSVRLLGAAETLAETLGRALPVSISKGNERTLADAHTALNEEEFADAWAEGRAMSLEQAIFYALEEASESPTN